MDVFDFFALRARERLKKIVFPEGEDLSRSATVQDIINTALLVAARDGKGQGDGNEGERQVK